MPQAPNLKFLGDMGISLSSVKWLRNKGFDAIHLREEHLQTSSDKEILKKANIENRIILTCDLDFGTLLAFSKVTLPSVIIFRLTNEKSENINKKIDEVIQKFSNELNNGVIVVVDDKKFRLRYLPIQR